MREGTKRRGQGTGSTLLYKGFIRCFVLHTNFVALRATALGGACAVTNLLVIVTSPQWPVAIIPQ